MEYILYPSAEEEFYEWLTNYDVVEKIKSWKVISNLGTKVKTNWISLAKNYKIKIKVQGLNALPRFDFENMNNLYYKTLISQEFLKKNILASNSIYICTEHSIKIFDNYFNILYSIFCKINKSIEDKIDQIESKSMMERYIREDEEMGRKRPSFSSRMMKAGGGVMSVAGLMGFIGNSMGWSEFQTTQKLHELTELLNTSNYAGPISVAMIAAGIGLVLAGNAKSYNEKRI
jgi:hypothetical protein